MLLGVGATSWLLLGVDDELCVVQARSWVLLGVGKRVSVVDLSKAERVSERGIGFDGRTRERTGNCCWDKQCKASSRHKTIQYTLRWSTQEQGQAHCKDKASHIQGAGNAQARKVQAMKITRG